MRRRDPADAWRCAFCGTGRSGTRKPAARASACLCAECAERSRWRLADRWRERAEGILLQALRRRDPTAGRGRASGAAGPLDRHVWRGNPLWYRRDTSDLEIIREVLPQPWSRGAYWVPAAIKPRVILDVGGHIGIAAVYLASLFEMRRPRALLVELGIRRVDVIKIDAEGAECDVLTGLDPAVLRSTGWITGELHGERETELLGYLSRWFDLRVTRSPGRSLCKFDAGNKALATKLSGNAHAGGHGVR